MKKLTDGAKNRLDGYLTRVRVSLQGCTSVDVDEVERDIKEHIESELSDMSEPVSFKELEAVLGRLGSPTQWVPEEEISGWRRIISRLRTGPEDWRLAYISFGLFLLSFLFAKSRSILFLFFSPILILKGMAQGILLLASFLMSRTVISLATEPDELRGKKWLIYPSLIAIYLPAAVLLLFWPSGIFSKYSTHTGQLSKTILEAKIYAVGIWWVVLSVIFCIWPNLLRAAIRPFAEKFDRKEALIFLLIGFVLLLFGIGETVMPYLR